MAIDVGKQVAALRRMTAGELRERYAAVFGEATAANNKTWLVRRIAWRIQAAAAGGLSDRARARALELAGESDMRVTAPADAEPAGPARSGVVPRAADPRFPRAGTVLTRTYKGAEVRVEVRADGFAFDGEVYPSLSAVAKAVTGSHLNGFAFFRLGGKGAGS
jgi:hypothetical protein